MPNQLNAREELEAAATWLGFHHEDLSFGLKCPEHALKLWRYWMARPELPEFCDGAESNKEATRLRAHVRKALGYDPWLRAMKDA